MELYPFGPQQTRSCALIRAGRALLVIERTPKNVTSGEAKAANAGARTRGRAGRRSVLICTLVGPSGSRTSPDLPADGVFVRDFCVYVSRSKACEGSAAAPASVRDRISHRVHIPVGRDECIHGWSSARSCPDCRSRECQSLFCPSKCLNQQPFRK